MVKTIFKEIVITIAILVILLLILGIILYNNMTINKIIPEIKAYETPAKIKDEISAESETGFQNEILTYEVTEADLKLYTKEKIYNAGKSNPFMQNSTGINNTINSNTNYNKLSNSLNNSLDNVLNTNKTQTTK